MDKAKVKDLDLAVAGYMDDCAPQEASTGKLLDVSATLHRVCTHNPRHKWAISWDRIAEEV